MSENNTDLNEVFEEEMDDADVITVPIDETLSNSGEAADAAAVGAALALKADKDELPATIKVNNQPADNQGLILIDGTDIPVSDSNTKTLAEAIEEASEMTAATIPMTGEAGAATIGETIGVLQETVEGIAGNMSADKIPMSEAENAETIAEAIGIIADNVEELAETVEGMEQKTADKVLMETGSTVTVKDAIETLDRTAVKSVNRKLPDASGDVDLSVVPLAENLQSDKLQSIEGEFTLRTTGGTGSVSDGKAYPQHIYGNSRHDGFVAEVLNLTVIPIARTEPDEPITATIDRDTFLEEVEDSDTINLYYTTEWSEDPADYGVTVTGDPVAGDQITIVYVKEVRGTIVVAEPERLVGTGWNLFNYNAGYARVVKYSETYGYKIGGTFTSIAFAASLTDDRISLLPNIDGLFSVPGDGYVFVTGGNNTDTYILTTWSDWIEGPSTGYWEAYRESGIDLSAVVETYFPYGMLKVGTVRDEIDLVAKRTISRIERMVYNEENRATAAATGRAYDFDENNIYVVRAEPVLNAITIDSEYSVSEHGMEWFTETELPLDTEILYGKNLRDKLERNVLTISAQTLTEEEKSQVRTNIGAMSQAEGDTKLVAPTEAGTAGQLLHLKEDGGTEWTTQGTPTDAQVGTAVSAWLDAHPEATTTVEDGAISRIKLDADLKEKTDAVPDLKSALDSETDTRKDYDDAIIQWLNSEIRSRIVSEGEASRKIDDIYQMLDEMDSEHLALLHTLLDTAVEQKGIMLTDNTGGKLIDQSGNTLTGLIYAAITDNTFTSDIYPATSKAVKEQTDYVKNTLSATNEVVRENTKQISATRERVTNLGNELNDINEEHLSLIRKLTDTAIEQKEVNLCNNDQDLFIDGNSNTLSGGIYAAITDDTLESDIYPPTAKEVKKQVDILNEKIGSTFMANYQEMGLPVVFLDHPDILSLKSKADGTIKNVGIKCDVLGINTTLSKLKVQGSSSQAYEKKNYTLTFASNVCLKEEWGWHTKYVIKADWVDFSQMRNEIGAKIWGEVRKTRVDPTRANLANGSGDNLVNGNGDVLAGENDPALTIGLNYGAIDAFPICVVINGEYWGLYSMTIPKDNWMANMRGENAYEGIISAEAHGKPTRFRETVDDPNEDGEMYGDTSGALGYSIEYVPDEDNWDWVSASLNNLITAVMQSHSHASDYIDAISPYVDIDSAIDYYIFNCLINNLDGTDKNFLLQTWDGEKWYFAAYDMDGTFGNDWDGKSYVSVKDGCSFTQFNYISRLMYILFTYDKSALISRYEELRAGVLSEANLTDMIMNYAVNIPKAMFDYEALRWLGRPGTNTNNYNQIINYVNLRCKFLDEEIAAMNN